jgi:CDP-glycerol glycerophosphotransferase (TagB/SpsB family)
VDLDEPIITFLYSISKYTEYFEFIQDKVVFIFTLLKKQIIQFHDFGENSSEACRQKIFATIHNLSDNEAASKEINLKLFIK